jgi:TonB-linked SusC/RagA family outer membrane protein
MKTLKFRMIGTLTALFILLISLTLKAGNFTGTVPLSSETMVPKKNVTGTVTDEQQVPLPGVSIIIKGTTAGVVSNSNGTFTVDVPDDSTVLVFSFIGFITQEIQVGAQSVINVTMKQNAQKLDEFVVVAYGKQKKSHLTGSIASLKAEKLDEIPVSRLDQALQGKMSGVQVANIDPYAGEAPQIRVRGMGSISTNIDPLVVVDGFPVADGMSMVSMGDVESIEVLKDAASSALYGSRAANGVILITTKSGNIKKPKYNFKMYTGVTSAYKLPGVLSQSEQLRLYSDEAAKRRLDPAVDGTSATMPFDLTNEGDQLGYLLINYIGEETDWVSEALRPNGMKNNYQLSASGGSGGTNYYISGNFSSEEGIMKKSSYDKYSLRAKVDMKLSKNVTLGFNLNPSYSKKETPGVDLTNYLRIPSWIPIRHTEATSAITGQPVNTYAHPYHYGRLDLSGIGLDGQIWNTTSASASGSSSHNPVSERERTEILTDDYRLQSNIYLTFDLTPGLQFKTSNGAYVTYREFNEKLQTEASKAGDPNKLTRTGTFRTDLLTENTLNYTKKIGNHDFGGLLGFTAQKISNVSNTIVATGFPDEEILSFNMASTLILDSPALPGTTSYNYTESMVSALGRINYSFKGKYLLSASFRADGSSKFAEGHKWGNFPAASVGWRASEEQFMKGIVWLTNLKFRVSYGLTGNNNIPQYSYMNYLNTSNYPTGTGIGTLHPGLASNNTALGNPSITWEQTKEANFGIDLGFFKSRLNLSAEYYNSTTKAMLLQSPSMYITGHQTYWNNIGEVSNKGVELELSSVNIDKRDFKWNMTANLSANKNKLLGYGNKDHEDNFGERNEVYRAIVGEQAIQFYGFQSAGVYLTFEEVADAKAMKDPETGMSFNWGDFTPIIGGLKVVNQNGDYQIDSYDRVVLGDPFPDFTWGLTNTFSYKNFDLSFLFQGVQGVDIIDGNMNYNETLRTNTEYTNNRFVSPAFPGDGQTVYGTNTAGKFLLLSDYGIVNGSYTALRDLTFGYSAPKKLARSIKLSALRVYFSAQNLLYLMSKDFDGINPEARRTSGQYASPLIDGYQRGVYPINRTFTFGVDVTF